MVFDRSFSSDRSFAGHARFVLTRLKVSVLFTMDEPGINDTIELLERFLKILKEEQVFDQNAHHPVVRFLHPSELHKEIPISLHEESASDEEIERAIRQTIRYSVKTSSPHFHNQLYAGIDKYGLIGSWLTDVLNTSIYTYEVAPVFTLMEMEIIRKSAELFGYPADNSDGILNPGGSLSNMYGMVMARFRKTPNVKELGLRESPQLVCFTSEQGHYSIVKAAHWLGLGVNNVYKVQTDEYGRMKPNDLRRLVKKSRDENKLPFFVNATCGSTVLGAIDPLEEIYAICQEEELWFHVDACLGGSVIFSKKYQHRLLGIALSDSLAWNPHKMLGVPLQCSLFLVKHKAALDTVNSVKAKYLFQQDKFYDVTWDVGDKSVQCGRKVDAMKFWLMWKARGTSGFEQSVEKAMYCAEYFLKRIKETPGFRPVLSEYECNNVCFWYIPPSMRGQEETPIWWRDISRVTTKIKESMVLDGSLMIGYTPLPNLLVNFFRMVVSCEPPPTEASMDYVISQIERFGANL
ncbi:cysteine sulfinic acid decarboxylase-like [Pseudomyrmex gracilis]|uniref:cysteine sulfinic acid decarboxylase-like n=1 Tax=Pseudomyrmex gracilis TaxID=219809 RepID=UPI000994B519|nr:cysteine sulfinic acid decarboxylase-like [Pseudomyrmex gracilis]